MKVIIHLNPEGREGILGKMFLSFIGELDKKMNNPFGVWIAGSFSKTNSKKKLYWFPYNKINFIEQDET